MLGHCRCRLLGGAADHLREPHAATALNDAIYQHSKLLRANKAVQHVLETADKGMVFRPGLHWPAPGDARKSTRHAVVGDAPKSTGHSPGDGDASTSMKPQERVQLNESNAMDLVHRV